LTEPIVLTVDEVAERLRIGRAKAYAMVASGELPAMRLGHAIRVPLAALCEWVERRTPEVLALRESVEPHRPAGS
jgi:excisionase family DNA binding protein